MPIRPENRGRYPKDWKRIRAAILERAGNHCERCGLPNYAVGYRDESGEFVPACGNQLQEIAGEGRMTYAEAVEVVDVNNCCRIGQRRCDDDGNRWFVVILTIAHLDHIPENCDPANLAALCQRCHIRHDARMKADGRKQRAAEERDRTGLFAERGA